MQTQKETAQRQVDDREYKLHLELTEKRREEQRKHLLKQEMQKTAKERVRALLK